MNRPEFADKLEAFLAEFPVERRRVITLNDAYTLAGEPTLGPAAGPCIPSE
jgi:hypothetical protein